MFRFLKMFIPDSFNVLEVYVLNKIWKVKITHLNSWERKLLRKAFPIKKLLSEARDCGSNYNINISAF